MILNKNKVNKSIFTYNDNIGKNTIDLDKINEDYNNYLSEIRDMQFDFINESAELSHLVRKYNDMDFLKESLENNNDNTIKILESLKTRLGTFENILNEGYNDLDFKTIHRNRKRLLSCSIPSYMTYEAPHYLQFQLFVTKLKIKEVCKSMILDIAGVLYRLYDEESDNKLVRDPVYGAGGEHIPDGNENVRRLYYSLFPYGCETGIKTAMDMFVDPKLVQSERFIYENNFRDAMLVLCNFGKYVDNVVSEIKALDICISDIIGMLKNPDYLRVMSNGDYDFITVPNREPFRISRNNLPIVDVTVAEYYSKVYDFISTFVEILYAKIVVMLSYAKDYIKVCKDILMIEDNVTVMEADTATVYVDELSIKRNEYIRYIEEHKANVKLAWDIISKLMNNNGVFDWGKYNNSTFSEVFMNDLIQNHDNSKYSYIEFEAYRNNFYPMEGETKNKKAFDEAWRHHQDNNMHHWQSMKADNYRDAHILDYTIEMVCDWYAMAMKFNEHHRDYWNREKDKIELLDWQKQLIEDIYTTLDTIDKKVGE